MEVAANRLDREGVLYWPSSDASSLWLMMSSNPSARVAEHPNMHSQPRQSQGIEESHLNREQLFHPRHSNDRA